MKFIGTNPNFLSAAVIYSGRTLETVLMGILPGEKSPVAGGVAAELRESFRQLDEILAHSREQVAYFGPDGLLRRHAYTVDVMGGAAGTKRRVYSPDATKQKISEPVLVAIDIRNIAFSTDWDAAIPSREDHRV